MDVLRIVTVFRQHILVIILLPLAVLIGTLGYVMIRDSQYEVTAQLLMQFGPELAPGPTSNLSGEQPAAPQLKRVEDATAEVQIQKDQGLVREVVESLGEDFFYNESKPTTLFQWIKYLAKSVVRGASRLYEEIMIQLKLRPRLSRIDKVVLLLQNNLQIEPVPKSEVIEIKLQYPDPVDGRTILDRFVKIYLDSRARIFSPAEVGDFLLVESETTRKALAANRQQLANTRQSLGAWSIDDQRRLLLESKNKLDQRRAEMAVEISGKKAELASLSRDISTSSGPYLALRPAAIPALEDRYVQTQTDLQSLQSQFDEVRTELDRVSSDLGRLSRSELELDQLTREVIRLDRRSQIYEAALDRARVAAAVSSAKLSNISVLAKPQASILPVWPRLTRLFLIAGALAVILAVGLVLILEALWPRVRDNSDLAALLPKATVAAIPDMRLK